MFQILEAEELTTNIYMMNIKAERLASSCMPGQFLIVRPFEDSERVPLTICDYDREKGTVKIVFQTVGATTFKMASLKAGDSMADVVGPLGQPSELTKESPEALKKKKIL